MGFQDSSWKIASSVEQNGSAPSVSVVMRFQTFMSNVWWP